MVWDGAGGYVLLFGGRDASTDFNDTWAFNGTAWTNLGSSHAPPPLTSGRVAYDARDHDVFLYGGYSIMAGAPSYYDFTWTFARGTWTNITSKVLGAPSDPHVVTYATYDDAIGKLLLFGGNLAGTPTCSATGFTWTFAHDRFTNLSSGLATAPPLGQGSRMMVYDPLQAGVLLYGGWDGPNCPSFSNQTWVLHAGSWTQLPLTTGPGPLWDGAMAADQGKGKVLVFGGNTAPYSSAQTNATWSFGA
jgi:hypothetical protein